MSPVDDYGFRKSEEEDPESWEEANKIQDIFEDVMNGDEKEAVDRLLKLPKATAILAALKLSDSGDWSDDEYWAFVHELIRREK
jgi:hypothetical protein